MSTNLLYLIVFTWCCWYDVTYGKPVEQDGVIKSLIQDNISQTLKEKAEAIDNLLRLLSEIDLPSICDAISAQKKGADQQMETVDAILAEAARSQAMTLIPTNLPETPQVTRPGNSPLNFAGNGQIATQKVDDKQASQEVAISRSEGKMGRLSLDIAAAMTATKDIRRNNLKKNRNVDVTVASSKTGTGRTFSRRRFMRPKSTLTTTIVTTTPPTTSTTTMISTNTTKMEDTIPTLAGDLMLQEGIFESGDGENLIDRFTTEKYTTLRMEDEGDDDNKILRPSLDNKLKKVLKNQEEISFEQKTEEPLHIEIQTKASTFRSMPTSIYKTVVPIVKKDNNAEEMEDTTLITPTSTDDLGWGFTIPTNTTFGEFMFGNITFNDNLSDELAAILNSTLPLDFLVANDTLYNEFMTILNNTLAHEEGRKQELSPFDMAVNETGDYQSPTTLLIDYISNMTDALATYSTEQTSIRQPEIKTNDTVNRVVHDSNQPKNDENNSSSETAYATYLVKLTSDSDNDLSTTVKSQSYVTDPAHFEYVDTRFPQYPLREKEDTSNTIPRKTDFAAGDYYEQEESDNVNMLAGSNNLIVDHDDIKSQFKHSGFAPLNHNEDYKINAKKSGLTYLGFDFKNARRRFSPYTPKVEINAVAATTNQKTIWSESTQKQATYPTGYTCPGLFGYYGDAHDCKAFFICSWGVPYRFHCPPDTIWSSEESVCNWSRDVECHETK